MSAGYSGTPLARKLSLKPGLRCRFEGMPPAVRAEIAKGAGPLDEPDTAPWDAVHLFASEAGALGARLAELRHQIAPDGFVWVSWPKRASKVPTDITEDTIRALALPLGFVDVKVCAVDGTWSGLKLMIRKALRAKT